MPFLINDGPKSGYQLLTAIKHRKVYSPKSSHMADACLHGHLQP